MGGARKPKLTKEQKIQAYTMRLDGHTYQEIADSLGVSMQSISTVLPHEKRAERYDSFIYRNITLWMEENDISMNQLAKMTGVCHSTISNFLYGETSPKKDLIDEVLRVTGMKYEYAFQVDKEMYLEALKKKYHHPD